MRGQWPGVRGEGWDSSDVERPSAGTDPSRARVPAAPLREQAMSESASRAPRLATTSHMPDVAGRAVGHAEGTLDWVGMGDIRQPIEIRDGESRRAADARVQVYVNLADASAKGIHMSRLYLILDEHATTRALTTRDSSCCSSRSWSRIAICRAMRSWSLPSTTTCGGGRWSRNTRGGTAIPWRSAARSRAMPCGSSSTSACGTRAHVRPRLRWLGS